MTFESVVRFLKVLVLLAAKFTIIAFGKEGSQDQVEPKSVVSAPTRRVCPSRVAKRFCTGIWTGCPRRVWQAVLPKPGVKE